MALPLLVTTLVESLHVIYPGKGDKIPTRNYKLKLKAWHEAEANVFDNSVAVGRSDAFFPETYELALWHSADYVEKGHGCGVDLMSPLYKKEPSSVTSNFFFREGSEVQSSPLR